MGMDHRNTTTHDYNNNTTDDDTSPTFHDYGTPVVVTLSFFLVVSMILALVGNVMVILTIGRHRGMRTRTNILLGNLAVADILVAVLDMPIALVTIINHDWMFSQTFCVMNGFAVGLGLMLSVHTLMWISIHKFLSITRPFSQNVTQCKIVLIMVGIWTWTIFYNLTATPLIGMTQTVYKKGSSQCGPVVPTELLQRVHSAINTLCNLVIPMTVMVYCYYQIFKEVKDHLERMRDLADAGMRNSLIQQKQITETLCIVLLCFFLFWAPYIGYSMSLVFCGETCVNVIFNPISYLCGYMNSACNPVIYALRSPSFRRGFKEIIFGTPTHLPGSGSRQGGILVSFRNTLIKRSVRGQRLRNENGARKISHPRPRNTHLPSHTPAHNNPLPIPKLSISTTDPPELPGANGDLHVEEGNEVITERVQFEIGSHSQVDLDSTPLPGSTEGINHLRWQPLQEQVTISRSCTQLAYVTCTIPRSASAGEILDSHRLQEATEQKVEVVEPKRRHHSEVHRPLMWQASVDHLTATPRRRRRRTGDVVVSPLASHLGVRKLISGLRKSFTDLFNIDEQERDEGE